MKRCAQCGAEYDDHVEFCFVDGSELGAGVVPAAPPVPVVVNEARPASTSRGTAILAVVILMIGGLVLLGGLAAALMLIVPGSKPPPPEPVPVPVPAPAVPVVAPPPAPAPVVARVGFTSTPDRAELWEGDTLLCTTPCTVEHPDHAPVPRQFVLKRDGYVDTPHVMADPGLPQHVSLRSQEARPIPRPARPTSPKPDIVFER
jgi:hypothetical protein